MQQQTEKSFVMKMADYTGTSSRCTATTDPARTGRTTGLRIADGGVSVSDTIDLAAAYRASRLTAHNFVPSYGGTGGFYRRAA